MMTRIVRLSLQPESVSLFVEYFNDSYSKILAFEGCKSVALKRDVADKNVVYTYSIWENENCLNKYRESDFFKMTWSKVKPLFSAPAQAFSFEDLANTKTE